MEVYQAENSETLEFLQKNQFNIYTTLMDETAEDLYKRFYTAFCRIIRDRTFRIK
jgi:TrmH family RNA methyltransferase